MLISPNLNVDRPTPGTPIVRASRDNSSCQEAEQGAPDSVEWSKAFNDRSWKVAGIAGVVSSVATTASLVGILAAGPGSVDYLGFMEPVGRLGAYVSAGAAGVGVISSAIQGLPDCASVGTAWKVAQGAGIASAVGYALMPLAWGTPAFFPAAFGTFGLAALATGAAVTALATRG